MPWMRIESTGYWVVAVATFLAVAVWESLRPKGHSGFSTERRWGNHAVILAVSTLISMGVFRATPVIVAASMTGSRFGLLNKPWLPFAARCLFAVLILDLVKYATHRACHSVTLLWRVHQVHHSDPDFDVSTALRVHPIESLVMQGTYLAAVAILAPPVGAVVVAELLAAFLSFFGHANARLPEWLENPLRAILVTPDMHRIHHSEEPSEQTKNFGDIFPWWDHLLGTYVATPAAGQDRIIVGLKEFQTNTSLSLAFMLRQPFRREQDPVIEDLETAASVPTGMPTSLHT
jgi:sterol desaturase/sphingolipid hydroxylase (fatty acid hydroxylase superfamily)